MILPKWFNHNISMCFRQEKKITQLKPLQDMFLILRAPDTNFIFLTVTGNIKFEKSSCESMAHSLEIKNISFSLVGWPEFDLRSLASLYSLLLGATKFIISLISQSICYSLSYYVSKFLSYCVSQVIWFEIL